MISVHYEGWSHFKEGRQPIEQRFAAAPSGITDRIVWAPVGEALEIDA